MITATALALVLAASAGPLDEARQAFAAGDYARAERLALETQPVAPAALYLAGLARFRAGSPAGALALLDLAGEDADASGPWHYNRGACLASLDRPAEAEREFLAAANDPGLAAVALVQAGHAALDRGALARARRLAARARAVASGPALDLVADLDAAVAVAEAAPAGGLPAPEPLPAPRRLAAVLRLEGGQDDNALQAGSWAPGDLLTGRLGRVSSRFARADAEVSVRAQPGARWLAELDYSLGQVLYQAKDAQEESLQQHLLTAAIEGVFGERLRLGAAAVGHLAYVGRADVRGLQRGGGFRLYAGLDEGPGLRTRLDLGWTGKEGLSARYRYLTGDRLDAALAQEWRGGVLGLRGGVLLRSERIGEGYGASVSIPPPPDDTPPSMACPAGCTGVAVEPFGYDAVTGWVSAQVTPARWLQLDLSGGYERRSYHGDERVLVAYGDGSSAVAGRRHRSDDRWFTAEQLTVRVGVHLAFTLRHELLADHAHLNGREPAGSGMMGGGFCSGGDPVCPLTATESALSFTKNVFSIGTSVAW